MVIPDGSQAALPGLEPPAGDGAARTVSDETCRDIGLSSVELWHRYFELGGMRSESEIEQFLRGGRYDDPHDHDVLAQALNERLSELGQECRVDYLAHRRRSATTSHVALGLLGSFRLSRDGEPVRLAMNAQRLVCFLALHQGFLLRQHVAGSLWGAKTDHQAAGSLRSALWRLGELGPLLIEIEGAHLRLLPSVAVDLDASESLTQRLLGDGDLAEADLGDDARLADDLLPDWTEDWVLDRREQHAQHRVRALEVLCLRLSTLGRHGAAVQAGMLAVAADPLRESAHRALMLAYLAEDNAAAAAKQYETLRALLLEELDVEPASETQELVAGLHTRRR